VKEEQEFNLLKRKREEYFKETDPGNEEQGLNSLVSPFVSVASLLEKLFPPVSVGCPLIDNLLSGGLRRGEICEVVGESSAGKSQFCLHCTLTVARAGGGVAYLNSEGAFPVNRLQQMASAQMQGEVSDILDRICIQKIRDHNHLLAVLTGPGLAGSLSSSNMQLLVIDSLASVIRYTDADDNIGESALDWSTTVQRLGQAIADVAQTHNHVSVLVVNQVSDKFDQPGYSPKERKSVACLGQVWAQFPHTRLWLTKTKFNLGKAAVSLGPRASPDMRLRKIEVDFSSRVPPNQAHFVVDSKGIWGIKVG